MGYTMSIFSVYSMLGPYLKNGVNGKS